MKEGKENAHSSTSFFSSPTTRSQRNSRMDKFFRPVQMELGKIISRCHLEYDFMSVNPAFKLIVMPSNRNCSQGMTSILRP